MAAILSSAAAAKTNSGKSSAYYDGASNDSHSAKPGKPNPVHQALDTEIKIVTNHIRKRAEPKFVKPENEACSRCGDSIFDLWNKYEPKLSKVYYQTKLLEMGDFLLSMKEYKLALWLCYERYLLHFDCGNFVEITEGRELEEIFFPDGLNTPNAGLTFRALMGKCISMYQVIKLTDGKLQNKQSVDQCLQILSFIRLIMQIVLPTEKLCWLIYNGSIHIYTISRHLMTLGHSSQVLEYVIWASVCMETSIPLLSVKYLVWRSTLYTAVCQCYYDCKAPQHAEAFARRGLAKINELNQLEGMSNSGGNSQSMIFFRQATIKMAIMVFKRAVFETRRKPKGLLRPKTRANYRDVINTGFPRTTTEKLLTEMFEGSAAQFLAVVEGLSDSNRRTLLTGPPAQDNEPEILDVYVELFMAGQELLAGGGGLRPSAPKAQSAIGAPPLSGVTSSMRLMESAVLGIDGIPIDAAIKFVKLAYNYEHWEVFDHLVDPIMAHLSITNSPDNLWHERLLELLIAMERLNINKKNKKKDVVMEEAVVEEDVVLPINSSIPGTSMKSTSLHDDHINLADVLMTIVTGPFKKTDVEIDIIVDAALFLWNKCKVVFQKYQTGSVDNPRYLHKMDSPHKWMYLLDTVHNTLCWCGISAVDPALTAEVVLRLAMLYESSAYLDATDERSGMRESKTTLTDVGVTEMNHSRISMMSSPANITAKGQLLQAKSILELGLKDVSFARQAVVLNDGKSIADVCWVKELNPEVFQNQMNREISDADEDVNVEELIPESMKESATTVWNMIKDLNLELLLMYHRVCLKLSYLKQQDLSSKPKEKVKKEGSQSQIGSDKSTDKPVDDHSNILTFEELIFNCKKNQLSKALLFMENALLSSSGGSYNGKQKKLLEEAVAFIQKAQLEEKRIFLDNQSYPEDVKARVVPPAPILLSRTDTTMVFQPAPFIPKSGEKIAWYRIYARNSTGSNVKVRLNDYHLPGTGNQVPVVHLELSVSGLTANERYVFAVAAYDYNGKIIGGIGETSKPILASHPLPVLMTWAFLSQISYQVGYYEVTRQAFNVLWDYFISEKPAPPGVTHVTPVKNDFKLTLHKLNPRAICLSSPVLLRQFLTSIFVSTDVAIRGGELFCDVICNKGPMYNNQVSRMLECEKLLIAIELSGWLNEANLALQSVIQCYGLLAPLLFYKIPSNSVIQILQRSHSVLQEIPTGLILKRQGHIADSLHHMTACITYHVAKALRTWGQRSLANSINEAGRKLLAVDNLEKEMGKDGGEKAVEQTESIIMDPNNDAGSMTLQALKKKRKGRNGQFISRDDTEGPVNEELKALEAHILRLTRTSQHEMELSGSEDPNILHAYIAFLPAKMAYKEVLKFKRRARFLEFVVQVAQKGLVEGLSDQVIEWCEDCIQWLLKRNEQIIGNRAFMTKQPGAITVSGDDPKKFAAAMVEYSKDKDASQAKLTKVSPANKGSNVAAASKPRRRKYKPFNNYSHLTDTVRHAQEEKEAKAVETLGLYFGDLYRTASKKRRLRKINTEELPWRSQMKVVLGLSCFQSFLQKLEKREKILGSASSNMYKTSFLDQEWFTFDTAGTLVVGWEGGPARQSSRPAIDPLDDIIAQHNLDMAMTAEKRRSTAIEIAAAAVIGAGVASVPGGSQQPEFDDTPRTYRSDMSTIPETNRTSKRQQEEEASLLSTRATIQALDKTFTYLKQSLILAHRGQHWTLLQNICNSLWNCAHTALLRASTANQTQAEIGLLTVETLRSLIWKPFYFSVDCLLDMMYKLQINFEQQTAKAKSKSRVLGSYFENWFGDVKNEKGGANLKFDEPLDDRSVMDVRWIRRYVLRVMEMLYYEQKWEKLVDLALRFNALTNYRYAEQVIPLLVQAQRKLTVIIKEVGGHPPPQKQFKTILHQMNGVMSAKDYLQCQLKIQIDRSDLKPVEPGAHIDPLGHNVYSANDAHRLICVPLDYEHSLDTLRKVLDQSRYPARALRHCRKMLVLYLAGQQNTTEETFVPKSPSKVEFLPNTAHPEPTVPADLKKEEFLSTDDVQTSPIPRSQIRFVIESYEKTIDMLMAKNQKGLGAQAMYELGNLYYHTKNTRSAFKWWCEALDIIVGVTDCIHRWKSVLNKTNTDDESTGLLSRCGLWGCLLGGIIASSIAQYILSSDLGLKLECCFLSGYFFKALFRASLPHPTSDRDYAVYDIGEGCEVTNLVPGIDLLSDRFRADGRQVVAALRWVTEELSRGGHNLFVLPLLTLNQYFTTFVCRDLQRSVDCRILKVRVLTDLRLFTEAFMVLRRLLHGERLPQVGDSGFRHVESKMGTLQFDTSKPILETCNLKVLESIIDKRLPASLATLYGPHLTCHLLLVQAHLLVTVADTLPVIPALAEAASLESQFIVIKARTLGAISHVGMGTRAPRHVSATSQNEGSEDRRDDDYSEDLQCFNKRFTESKKQMTLEIVKATILNMAEQMVTTLCDIITENAEHDKTGKGLDNLTAAELELVILCKLQQAAISRQKHHAPLASRIIFSALKLLQASELFKPKKQSKPKPRPSSIKGHGIKKPVLPDIKLTQANSSQFEYQDFQCRSRLDIRLWLKCRLELVECLMLEIKGMGDVKGSENKFMTEIADCRQYCVEGVGESDMIGDIEMQAEFFIHGAFLNIMEGKNIQHTISLLQEAQDHLSKAVRLSDKGGQLLVQSLMLATDLEMISAGTDAKVQQKCLTDYIHIQNILLDQMESVGESIERYRSENDQHLSVPLTPLKNVYLPHLLTLSQLKLRVGHRLARNTALKVSKGVPESEAVYLWVDALSVLVSALDISRNSVGRDSSLETEILFNLGKVQKMLLYLDKFPARKAANTLLEAIKISYSTDHNLSLIRQAYLEISQIYLHSSNVLLSKESSDPIGDSGDESSAVTPTPSSKALSSSQSKRKWKPSKVPEEQTITEESCNSLTNSITSTNQFSQSLDSQQTNMGSLDLESEDLIIQGESNQEEYSTPALDIDVQMAASNQNTANENSPENDQSNMSFNVIDSGQTTPVIQDSNVSTPIPESPTKASRDASPVKVVTPASITSLDPSSVSSTLIEPISSPSHSKPKKKKGKKDRSKSKLSKEEDFVGDSEKEKRAAWLAMRCAAVTGQAQRAKLLLKGDPDVTQKITERAVREIPDFLALDLMGSYVLGEKKKIFKNEIEEELSTMKGADEIKEKETYDEQVLKTKLRSQELSWIQILGYQSILHRLCSTSTVSSSSVPTVTSNIKTQAASEVTSDFAFGFIGYSDSTISSQYNNETLRYMLCSGPWVSRLNCIHHFLSTNLPSYAVECCAVYPPSALMLPVSQAPPEIAATQKSYSSNLSMSSEIDIESTISGSMDINIVAPPGFKKDPFKPQDKGVVSPEDNEICIQWYRPTLEESDLNQPDESVDKKIMLLYSLFKKNVSATYSPGIMWVSLGQLAHIHDRLLLLSQKGEISLADKQKTKEPVSTSTSQTKPKKAQRIKALSPKIERDEQLETLLSQCLEDCSILLSPHNELDLSTEIPFEVNKTNIKNLEAMFDPSLGLTLKSGDLLNWLIKLFPSQ